MNPASNSSPASPTKEKHRNRKISVLFLAFCGTFGQQKLKTNKGNIVFPLYFPLLDKPRRYIVIYNNRSGLDNSTVYPPQSNRPTHHHDGPARRARVGIRYGQ